MPWFGAAEAAPRIELALAEDADVLPGALPFVALGGGRFSRVLLARLADAAGRTVQLLACKLQRDAYLGLGEGPGGRIDNREVEAMWSREKEQLDRFAGVGAPAPFAAAPGRGVVPALAYDAQRRVLFEVRSPRTFEVLEVCCDDEALHAAGLPPWSSSLQRYLWCRVEPNVFYAFEEADAQGRSVRPAASVRVVRGAAVFGELAASWRALDAASRAELARGWPDGAAALADVDAEQAAQRFVPLCFHPAHVLLTAFLQLHFDEYCALAGGATVERLAAAAAKAGAPGRQVAFAAIRARLDGERQWWSLPWVRGDAPQKFATAGASRLRRLAAEAALLKLTAWIRVARAAQRYQEVLGQPHLGLSPDNAMLTLAAGDDVPAPARWCFHACLVDVASSRLMAIDGLCRAESVPALVRPASNVARTFASPLAGVGRAALEVQVRATARRTAAGLRLELHAAQERFTGVVAGDVVRLLPDAALPVTRQAALLGVVAAVGDQGRSAEVDVQLDEAMVAALPEKELVFAAVAACHPRLQTPCDLFSLGMLLACALLQHDERDAFAVREVWDRILDRFDLAVSARAGDGRAAESAMRYLLDGERQALGSDSVLFDKGLRALVQAPVPEALWRDLLLLVARLLTHSDGFSFASHHGDVGRAAPAELLTAVLRQAEELAARLGDEVADPVRGEELAQIAQGLQAEVAAAMGAGGAP